jgi:cytochrome P450 family 103
MDLKKPTRWIDPPEVDPNGLIDDPHAGLRRLRSEHALVKLGEGHFMALRASDVLAMLIDPRTIQLEGADFVALHKIPFGPTARFFQDFFLFTNGAAHRERRGLFASAFSLARIRATQPRIRAIADEIVADLPRGVPFDFLEKMASRIPAEMIGELLGLPRADAPAFARWVYTVARAISPVYPVGEHPEIDLAAISLFEYVREALLLRVDAPCGDLLSVLVQDWAAERTLPLESLIHQVMAIIVAGVESTRAAFAMMIALLLEHPEQFALVRADPALIPGAIAEALRYEPSVASILRFTREPIEIGGALLPAGQCLRVSTLSALRDPAVYADPDRFDIRRTDHPRMHMVFGNGPHRCIGEMLARFEMQEGLAALLAGAETIRLVTAPRMIGFGGIREITAMEIQLD